MGIWDGAIVGLTDGDEHKERKRIHALRENAFRRRRRGGGKTNKKIPQLLS